MTKEQAQILWRIVNANAEFVRAYQCIMSDPPSQTAIPSDLPYPWSSFVAEQNRWNEFLDEWYKACKGEVN